MNHETRRTLVILGAGPAGLGAAYRLAQHGRFDVAVLERLDRVGGNAGSFALAGLQVDFGSHRLHPSCIPEVFTDIQSMIGRDLLCRPRHGRIRLRGRWLHFPLKPIDLAAQLPPTFLLGVMSDSFLKFRRRSTDENFATVLERGLGRTICRDFYFPYAEKIWGLPPQELDAEQARRRVSASSLTRLFSKVLRGIPGFGKGKSCFYYPKHGYGQISGAYRAAAEAAGARIILNASVTRVTPEKPGDVVVEYRVGSTAERLITPAVLSTIPLPTLVRLIQPAPPADVLGAAQGLKYRSMILVYLVLGTDRFTEFDAHYFPGTEIPITRLSEPKNYGLANVPGVTVLCAELPCTENDANWRLGDAELGQLVADSLARMGLPISCAIREVVTRRLPQAYPIYTRDYRKHSDRIHAWLDGVDGVITLGRQGLFAHDNTHHTLAMAYAATACLRDDGSFDRAEWSRHRRDFESHVVED